jgi:hypothetical protein
LGAGKPGHAQKLVSSETKVRAVEVRLGYHLVALKDEPPGGRGHERRRRVKGLSVSPTTGKKGKKERRKRKRERRKERRGEREGLG